MDQSRANFPTRRSKHREPQSPDDLRAATYPPPYPDGWYRLFRSKSLRRGQARYLECLGRALVVWRGEDTDEVFAMSAFCPHLGANLAGGRVCRDRIECPFHGWQFTGDGRAASVPYSDTVPNRVATESFPVQEVHGQIFMYHRGGGARQQAGEEVPYRVPRIPEVDDGSFVFRGHYEAGRTRMHIVEPIENAVDSAHFGHLHNRLTVPWTRFPIPGTTIEYTSRLDFDAARGAYSMPLLVETVFNFRGRRMERSRTRTRVMFAGVGSIMNLRITLPGWASWRSYRPICRSHPLNSRSLFIGSPSAAFRDFWSGTRSEAGSPSGATMSASGKKKASRPPRCSAGTTGP